MRAVSTSSGAASSSSSFPPLWSRSRPTWSEAPRADEWAVIADLVERYADFPLGAVDASVVVLADRLETDLIVTLDRRHFGAVQSPAGRRFRLLPQEPAVHEQATAYEAGSAARFG